MSNIWNWVGQSLYEGDEQRGWYRDWRRAMALDETDPAAAVALLDGTIARAENARDSWWKLFLEHWKLQILLNKSRDFGAALDCAARATVEVRQPQFDAFPQRICLHEDLITTYQGLDPQGYAPMIQSALDYMQREIAPGVECEACHRGLCAEFYRSTSHPLALQAAWDYLAIAELRNEDFHRAQAYLQLCYSLSVFKGSAAREELLELSEVGYDLVVKVEYTEGLYEILMWQALAARWNNDPNDKRKFQRACDSRARYGAAARPGYHCATVLFHEAAGELDKAVEMLNQEIEEISGRSEFWREATCRARKCELLQEMGLAWEADAAQARKVAQKLKNPEVIEKRLNALNRED